MGGHSPPARGPELLCPHRARQVGEHHEPTFPERPQNSPEGNSIVRPGLQMGKSRLETESHV